MSNFRGSNSKDQLVTFTKILKSRGRLMNEQPNNIKWVVKFFQKWDLTLLPKIRDGGVVVNDVSSTPK